MIKPLFRFPPAMLADLLLATAPASKNTASTATTNAGELMVFSSYAGIYRNYTHAFFIVEDETIVGATGPANHANSYSLYWRDSLAAVSIYFLTRTG
jgi:hypothetical protein